MATDPAQELYTCVVCGDSGPAALTAECNWCDGRYHLNPRNDVEGRDCGEVWVDEQYLALQFACRNCLSIQAAEVPPAEARKPARGPRPGRDRPRRYKRRA